MSGRLRRRSLGFRYVGAIVLGQLVLGSVLGLVVGLHSVRSVMESREEGLRQLSVAIASGLLPLVADQDPVRIQAQLDSILETSDGHGIVAIRVEDGSGRVVAETSGSAGARDTIPDAGPLAVFTAPRVVEQPVVVGGLEVARATVRFEPTGLREALLQPMGITALIVFVAVVVSALWGTFVLTRSVVEPVGALRDAATRIAEGDRKVTLSTGRSDEIGDLAESLETMTRQLEDREQRLRESYGTLEAAYVEQERMREQVQRMASAKSDFVAVASHELRSPLAVLQLYGEMLEEGQYGELPPASAEAVAAMLRATRRLTSIVATLMDVSLLERGTLTLEFGDVRVEDLVAQAVSDASVLGAKRGVTVHLRRPAEDLLIRADALRVRQVLDNLLSNAVKYSESGSDVLVTASPAGADVEVRVADHGRGIPPDRIDQLFEPFGRIDAQDDSAPGGVGLGLAVSAKIARAHGGTISVESNEGSGSVFVLRLPTGGPSTRRSSGSVEVV